MHPRVETLNRALRPRSPRERGRRRGSVYQGAAVAAALAATLMIAPMAPASAASSSDPIMFGASGSSRSMIQANEKLAGQRVNGARVFKKWDSALFTSSQTWARDTGHTLFVSIKSERTGGADIKFSDVANARPGSQLYKDMQRQAQQIKQFNAKVYVAYNHEPEAGNSATYGTGAQFAAAWRNLVSIYRAEGVRNAEYVWTMTAYGFNRTDSRRAELYYPGDAYVDHIAADGYNWYRCRDSGGQWRDLADIIEGHRQFGLKHPGKGLMLWEFGSTEDVAQAGRKAQWLRESQALFQKNGYEQYNVLLTWEGRNHTGSGKCGFDFNSSTSARNAWADWNSAPAYAARTVP